MGNIPFEFVRIRSNLLRFLLASYEYYCYVTDPNMSAQTNGSPKEGVKLTKAQQVELNSIVEQLCRELNLTRKQLAYELRKESKR